jgi:hypothetical protein
MFADDAEKSLDCWLNELLMKVVGVLRRENMDVWKGSVEEANRESGGAAFAETPPSVTSEISNQPVFFRPPSISRHFTSRHFLPSSELKKTLRSGVKL